MALEVKIKKQLGDFLLDIEFQTEGEVFALLGGSGCGKSLTLKCIAGVVTPDSGRIVLDGVELFDSEKKINLPPSKRGVGYLFQNYALFPNMTVRKNIEAGLAKENSPDMVDEAIKSLYLEEQADLYPRQLSGGQQQRTALARLLVSNPKLLLLDEPFSALDSYLKWQLELEVMGILEKFSGSTIFVSHNRDEVYRICDTIGVMEKGKISSLAPKWELFKKPKTLSACLLSGCKNISHAEPAGNGKVHCKNWGITLSTAYLQPETKFVGVRAHFWQPVAKGKGIECKITRIIEDVFSTIILLECSGEKVNYHKEYSMLRWEIAKGGAPLNYSEGEALTLGIDPAYVLTLCV